MVRIKQWFYGILAIQHVLSLNHKRLCVFVYVCCSFWQRQIFRSFILSIFIENILSHRNHIGSCVCVCGIKKGLNGIKSFCWPRWNHSANMVTHNIMTSLTSKARWYSYLIASYWMVEPNRTEKKKKEIKFIAHDLNMFIFETVRLYTKIE